eukprot:355606-Chlamydomonas_euryale.AAC.2
MAGRPICLKSMHALNMHACMYMHACGTWVPDRAPTPETILLVCFIHVQFAHCQVVRPQGQGLAHRPTASIPSLGSTSGHTSTISNVRTGEGVPTSALLRGDGHGTRRPACATPSREVPLHSEQSCLGRRELSLPVCCRAVYEKWGMSGGGEAYVSS